MMLKLFPKFYFKAPPNPRPSDLPQEPARQPLLSDSSQFLSSRSIDSATISHSFDSNILHSEIKINVSQSEDDVVERIHEVLIIKTTIDQEHKQIEEVNQNIFLSKLIMPLNEDRIQQEIKNHKLLC